MDSINVVTTFHEKFYDLYAKRMIQTFVKRWPKNIHLHVYYQGQKPDIVAQNVHYYDFDIECADFHDFAKRNEYRNKKRPANFRGKFKEFNFDAIRFGHKSYAVINHMKRNDSRYFIWIDADVVTLKSITTNYLKRIINDNCYISCLLRPTVYTECGFYILDTQHEYHNEFMNRFSELYHTDSLFNLPNGWHDCWAFDSVMYPMANEGKIKVLNLSGGDTGHVFVTGILGEKLDHLKGDRKKIGKSPERKGK